MPPARGTEDKRLVNKSEGRLKKEASVPGTRPILLAGLNAVGNGSYASVGAPFAGSDAIRVALVYRRAAVQLAGAAHATGPAIDVELTAFKRSALTQTF